MDALFVNGSGHTEVIAGSASAAGYIKFDGIDGEANTNRQRLKLKRQGFWMNHREQSTSNDSPRDIDIFTALIHQADAKPSEEVTFYYNKFQ